MSRMDKIYLTDEERIKLSDGLIFVSVAIEQGMIWIGDPSEESKREWSLFFSKMSQRLANIETEVEQ